MPIRTFSRTHQIPTLTVRSLHPFATLSLSVLTAAVAIVHSDTAWSAENPSAANIVFILADDLGYGDLACYGAKDVRTPHLDRLAREGVRFTQHYSNGTECSPTRTAFFTGRYQQRIGGLECAIGTGNVGRYDDAIRLANEHELGLPPSMAVFPRELVKTGYQVAGYGKWHLGYDSTFNPMNYGFKEFFGCLGGNVDYFTHKELSTLPVLIDGRHHVVREGYMTELITEEAVEFIRFTEKDAPFFLYVPYTAPHFPFQGPGDQDVEFNEDNWMSGTRAKYNELVEALDRGVGRIVAALARKGLLDETLIVFASDNGAMAPGSNAPLRDYKSKVFEGGIRVPLIMRWPGKLPRGATSTQPCMTFDLTRSFLELGGAPDDVADKMDGMDIVDHIRRQRPDQERNLFWRGRRGGRTERAVRSGDWKYIHRRLDNGAEHEYLFNLQSDPAENHDLLDGQPQRVARLQALLTQWEEKVKPVR